MCAPSRRARATAICRGVGDPRRKSVLAVGGELLLQRSELCKRRIRIDRAIAIARRRRRCIGTMRGTALALVAIPLVAAVLARRTITVAALASLLAIAPEFLAAPIAVALSVLALEAFARTVAALLTLLLMPGRGRSLCCRSSALGYGRFARLAKILAVAPAVAAMPLARAVARLAGLCCRLLAVLASRLLAMAVTIVPRTALIHAATGPPHLDQRRLSGNRGRGFGCGLDRSHGFGRQRLADRRELGWCFARRVRSGFNRRARFGERSRLAFAFRRGLFARSWHKGNVGQQRGRRRGVAGQRLLRHLLRRCYQRFRRDSGALFDRRFYRRAGCPFRRRRLGRNRLRDHARLRRQRRPALHAIAERAQDRGEILARRTRERRHRLRHNKRAAVERAGRLFAGRGFAPGKCRANLISKPLENIDAHTALAALPVAEHAIGVARQGLVDGERGAAGACQMLHAGESCRIGIVLLQRPEQQSECPCRRLEQRGHIDVIRAEAHAVFPQRRTRGLVEILHLGRDLRTLDHAERFDELVGDAARNARDVLGLGEFEQRPEQLFDMGLQPEIEPRLDLVARRARQPFVGDDAQPRMQRVVGRNQLRNRIASPAQRAVGGQHELLVGGLREFFRARIDLARQNLLRRRLQRLRVGTGFRSVGRKGETVEAADRVALDDDFAGLADFGIQADVLPQAAHQYTGTAINETLRKPFVQRVG